MTWINTMRQILRRDRVDFPCEKLNYCPYGKMVDAYPDIPSEIVCPVFKHHCPVYYQAEFVSDDDA